MSSGITGTRDMADDLRQIADITRAARIGEIASPEIAYAALMAGPSFFEIRAPKRSPRERLPVASLGAGDRRENRHAARRGPSEGHLCVGGEDLREPAGPLVAAITREAHRQGMRVWAHGMVFPATPFEVVDAGVDTVSHTCYLAYQAMAKRPDAYQHRFPIDAALFARDNPVMARLFADMVRRGTVLDATLHVYREVEAAAREQHKPPLCTVALAGRLTNQAYRAGVAISPGTDGDTPLGDPFPRSSTSSSCFVMLQACRRWPCSRPRPSLAPRRWVRTKTRGRSNPASLPTWSSSQGTRSTTFETSARSS